MHRPRVAPRGGEGPGEKDHGTTRDLRKPPHSWAGRQAEGRAARRVLEEVAVVEGRLFVVSGPSGVGKGSVIRGLCARHPSLFLSVSATTRPPRPGEIDGRDYLFVTSERFEEMIAHGELLEWADVFGRRYGTPVAPIREARAHGRDAILEIDVQGAAQVKKRAPDAVLVFIEPPSWDELERRLRSRGTEDPDALSRRLAGALEEMDQDEWFDHRVINDDLDHAADELAAIIESSRPTAGSPS